MSHTPAPWKLVMLSHSQYPNSIDSHGNIVLYTGIWASDPLANITLANAAPELLEALENIIGYRDRVDPLYFQLEKLDDYIRQARAAIRKAKGE